MYNILLLLALWLKCSLHAIPIKELGILNKRSEVKKYKQKQSNHFRVVMILNWMIKWFYIGNNNNSFFSPSADDLCCFKAQHRWCSLFLTDTGPLQCTNQLLNILHQLSIPFYFVLSFSPFLLLHLKSTSPLITISQIYLTENWKSILAVH